MIKEWIFHFCRNALRLPLGILIRKVHFDGTENFVEGVPVLLACNHPNSFLDGVVFEHMTGRRVYTLTRGDVFLKPMTNFLFRSMRLMPIFRASDASVNVAREGNTKTKDEIFKRFQNNETVLIFSEGISYPEKAVRRLKNGTGQIALDAAIQSNHTLDLHVVPTALNYSKFWSIMQTITVSYGKPIKVKDYVDLIEEDKKAFTNLVTQRIKEEFDNNIVTTKGDFTDEKEFAQEILINHNYDAFSFKIKNKWEYSVSKLNKLTASTAELIQSYKADLEKYSVLDSNVGNRSTDFVSGFVAISTIGVSLPLYVIWRLSWYGVEKIIHTKIRNVVFWDSMVLGLMMIVGLIITSVAGTILNGFIPGYWPWLILILGTYGAICWFRLIDSLPHLWMELKWLSLNKRVKEQIVNKRKAVLAFLE